MKKQPTAGKAGARTAKEKSAPVKLLAGGNPQIPKGDGDGPVQAYIDAMPGWKQDVGRWLDAMITQTLPGAHKSVRWNTPFYGVDEGTWTIGFHCLTKYVKVAFPMGAHMQPLPPEASKQPDVRYFHIHENEVIDEQRFITWVKQAAKLPGAKW